MKILRTIELIVSILSVFICLIFKNTNGYNLIFLLPLCFLVYKILFGLKVKVSLDGFADYAIEILSFVKYSIMPISIVLLQDYYAGILTSQIPNSNSVRYAIVLLMIECIIVLGTRDFINQKSENRKNLQPIEYKRPRVLFYPFAAVCIFLIIRYPQGFFPSQLFTIDEQYVEGSIDSSVDGLISMFFFAIKIFLLGYVSQWLYIKYKQNYKPIYIVLMYLALLVYVALCTSTGRWGIVLPIIAYVYIYKDVLLHNTLSKSLLVIVGIIAFVSFISISFYKFNWIFKNTSTNDYKYILNVYFSQLQEYLSGPRAVAQGIEAVDRYRSYIGIETLINDFTGSIPFVSHFVDQSNRINVYYNYYIKGPGANVTQIMPMINIGCAYFSPAFCWVFTYISIVLAKKLEKIMLRTKSIIVKFMLVLTICRFCLCIGFNTQIIFGFIISGTIPVLILNYLFSKFKLGKI